MTYQDESELAEFRRWLAWIETQPAKDLATRIAMAQAKSDAWKVIANLTIVNFRTA